VVERKEKFGNWVRIVAPSFKPGFEGNGEDPWYRMRRCDGPGRENHVEKRKIRTFRDARLEKTNPSTEASRTRSGIKRGEKRGHMEEKRKREAQYHGITKESPIRRVHRRIGKKTVNKEEEVKKLTSRKKDKLQAGEGPRTKSSTSRKRGGHERKGGKKIARRTRRILPSVLIGSDNVGARVRCRRSTTLTGAKKGAASKKKGKRAPWRERRGKDNLA